MRKVVGLSAWHPLTSERGLYKSALNASIKAGSLSVPCCKSDHPFLSLRQLTPRRLFPGPSQGKTLGFRTGSDRTAGRFWPRCGAVEWDLILFPNPTPPLPTSQVLQDQLWALVSGLRSWVSVPETWAPTCAILRDTETVREDERSGCMKRQNAWLG